MAVQEGKEEEEEDEEEREVNANSTTQTAILFVANWAIQNWLKFSGIIIMLPSTSKRKGWG